MTQGRSSREECPLLILKSLLENKEMTFGEIVGSIPHARGTVNKYLNELYNEGLIERRGRRGKYYLTTKGKEETLRRYGESHKKAFDDWMKSVIQLAQEGHAKILTERELEEIETPLNDLSKIPTLLDIEGLRRLGIKDSQIEAVKIVQEAVNNLEKMGIKAGILVKGEKGSYLVGARKQTRKVALNE